MTAGLWVFITVIALSLLGLILDKYLQLDGATTISASVQLHPLLGVAIIVVELAGTVGLASHFWGMWFK